MLSLVGLIGSFVGALLMSHLILIDASQKAVDKAVSGFASAANDWGTTILA